MMEEINNFYLEIHKFNDNKIEINASDGVFTRCGTLPKDDYFNYCDSRADEWLTSEFGNYDRWSKKDRKAIANKWIKAKKLPEGRYNYYFNLQDTQEIFYEAVKKLAQEMGITNYTLKLDNVQKKFKKGEIQ